MHSKGSRTTRSRSRYRATWALVLGLGACGIFAPAAFAEEESLPPVAVTYTGEVTTTIHRTEHLPENAYLKLNWTAAGSSLGKDGALPLTYTSMSGSLIDEYSNGCQEYNRTFTLPAENPQLGGWGLDENLEYPLPGWKYQVSPPSHLQPVHESYVVNPCNGNPTLFFDNPEPATVDIRPLVNEARAAEENALFETIEAPPGESTTVTREFNSNEDVVCTCLPDKTPIQGHVRLTISVDSSSGNNNVQQMPPTPPAVVPPPPTPPLTAAEQARQELKDAARARIITETAWAAGLEGAKSSGGAIGLAAALLLPSAKATLDSDLKTIKDPPLPDYTDLAAPAATAGAVGRSAGTLSSAESALRQQSAKVASITGAMYTTISRDSGAIAAANSSAAEEQAAHFSVLEQELDGVLAAQVKAGKTVAAALRRRHAHLTISKLTMEKAINAVEGDAVKDGTPLSTFKSLAGSALTAKRINLASELERGQG